MRRPTRPRRHGRLFRREPILVIRKQQLRTAALLATSGRARQYPAVSLVPQHYFIVSTTQFYHGSDFLRLCILVKLLRSDGHVRGSRQFFRYRYYLCYRPNQEILVSNSATNYAHDRLKLFSLV